VVEHPAIVAQLSKQMATYTPYVEKNMSALELSGYECLTTNVTQALRLAHSGGNSLLQAEAQGCVM
jgi:hypothetical protein